MKPSNLLKMALPALLFVAGAAAQDQHQPAHDQMQMNGMCGTMMSNMDGMSNGHADAAKVVDQLQKNLAAMQAHKKSGPLKAKLAEQATLLKDLQAKLTAHGMEMKDMDMKNMDMKSMNMKDMPGCCDNAPKK